MDPYQSCPCGSGKNFKWCCQPFFQQVDKARKLHQQGQHELALKTLAQLVEQNPGNAPILGYHAELLYMNGKPDEADETLSKAFAANPNLPFGHWLRGMIRKDEGEIIGALIQFRKAAELYDPKANEVLADIQAGIFDIEMRLNRPVAARAALERAMQYDSTAEELGKAFNNLFGEGSRLPEAARKGYTFRPADAAHKDSWQATLPTTQPAKLGDAQAAFEKLTALDAADTAAWFNLGLVRAWMGEHPKAIEALSKAVELDSDPEKIAEEGALIEVLRCGEGMEEQSDYIEHRIFFQLQQPQPIAKLLEEWHRNNRLSGAQQDQENGTLSALILEETPQFGIEVGAPVAKLGAYMLIVGNILRLWSPRQEGVSKVADEVLKKVGSAVAAPVHESGYCNFSDIAMEAMLIPTRETQISEIAVKLREHAENFFEEIWIHRPLKSLAGVSPVDAAAHPSYQKKLLGLVRFMEQCFISSSPRISDGDTVKIIVVYDFGRLRGKLGLAGGTTVPAAGSGPNIDVMSTAELATLSIAELSDELVEQAFRSALRLDARELAGKFAQYLVERPAGSADRYPFFNHLLQLAQAENDYAAVLSLLEHAERVDEASNNGQRKGDYTLRRGQALAKKGEIDQAYQVLQDLLNRNPDELKFYGPATETMLGQKRGPWALQFAEQGLAKARSQNNRDVEQYLLELSNAARKIG